MSAAAVAFAGWASLLIPGARRNEVKACLPKVCSGFGIKTCTKSRTYSMSHESSFTRHAVRSDTFHASNRRAPAENLAGALCRVRVRLPVDHGAARRAGEGQIDP